MAGLALTPSAFVTDFYTSFWWFPTAVLACALAVKLPTILRLWKDPLLRAVGGLLLLACAVFVCVAPSTIAWTNRVTGIPNFAAPLVYSLLTAFCGACLLLIIAWRNGPAHSAATRRARRLVLTSYAAVIVALWVLFALADAPVERLRDLDTYYANTPYMRELILLYLLAHCVAVLITCRLIWNWVRTDGLDGWLRWGLSFLGGGYALNLVFDAAKLTAVTARWTGHDLDVLSTNVAPPVAGLSAVLLAVGFILPHLGQYLLDRWRVRLAHRELRPLYRLLRSVHGSGVPFELRAAPELRLVRRETFIRDVLLPLARDLDEELRRAALDAALALGHPPERARALAAAVTLLDAAEARRGGQHTGTAGDTAGVDPAGLLREIGAVSRALRRHDVLQEVRALAGAHGTRTGPAAPDRRPGRAAPRDPGLVGDPPPG
ncbi:MULTISPECIES: MAB_1171c family putative transporter [unclassified Streptomyces]|uniref:MAB_1171c family putative transporter n=1 Tax=Streptomyces thermocoprophilus TaxID=78356 RepID=A0ABV5VIT3_9ACTN